MPTVWRDGNPRVVIHTDEHPLPHVHVFGDGETKIAHIEPEVVRRCRLAGESTRCYNRARKARLSDRKVE